MPLFNGPLHLVNNNDYLGLPKNGPIRSSYKLKGRSSDVIEYSKSKGMEDIQSRVKAVIKSEGKAIKLISEVNSPRKPTPFSKDMKHSIPVNSGLQ